MIPVMVSKMDEYVKLYKQSFSNKFRFKSKNKKITIRLEEYYNYVAHISQKVLHIHIKHKGTINNIKKLNENELYDLLKLIHKKYYTKKYDYPTRIVIYFESIKYYGIGGEKK